MINHLYILLKLYPEKDWDASFLSSNDNITWPIIQELSHIQWEWREVSANVNITEEIIESNPDIEWNHCVRFANNKNVKWSIIEKYIEKYDDLAECVSLHPELNIDIVKKYLHLKWSWACLSQHKNIYWNDIINNPNLPWEWEFISLNPNITWDNIFNNLDKKWDWLFISEHKCVTWDIIQKHKDLQWDWSSISRNPNITMDIVCNNPNCSWSPDDLVENENIILEHIVSAKHIKWNWRVVSLYAKGLTIELLREVYDKIKWQTLSSNKNLTWQIVEAFPRANWVWAELSLNPTITAKIVIDNIDKPWNWSYLSRNNLNRRKSIRRALMSRKYFHIWRHNIKMRKKNIKQLYEPVLDMLRLRIRDYNNKVRAKMTS